MTESNNKSEGERKIVARLNPSNNTRSGRPEKVSKTGMRSKVASYGGGGGGGYGIDMGNGGAISHGFGSNVYSYDLSTDFLELPNSTDELRNLFRSLYRHDPYIGRAIDILTTVPISKIRIGRPQAKDTVLADKAFRFCKRWAEDINLFEFITDLVFNYNLYGEGFPWAEDANPSFSEDILYENIREHLDDGQVVERRQKREDHDERHIKWLNENYKGWTSLSMLPPRQVKMQSFSFNNDRIFELILDVKTKSIVNRGDQGDEVARKYVDKMPKEIVESVRKGQNIILNTDPFAGSFVHYFARNVTSYEERGFPVLERIVKTYIYKDKLRQSQTSIASRHMTPMRMIVADGAGDTDLDNLREQVDQALQDPDYSILVNFEVRWEEMNSNGRLLELSGEYDRCDKELSVGVGIPESSLTGENAFQENKLNTELLNASFMIVRDKVARYVQRYLFEPMCRRMGFVEEDEDGRMVTITPFLDYSRLMWKDNPEVYEQLRSLNEKGILDSDTLLEYFNLDPDIVWDRLKKHMYTLKDPMMSEVTRSMASTVGSALAENSDAPSRFSEGLDLKYRKPAGEERF